ncbi:sigma-54 interaction domain-containing protein [Enterococcus sp. DIV0756]|uniref:sigma-54 interaction domain-containing protein n=1 Tax=Enterococcus sp. DIV0756 TaxID=2774636 RepID=UPI003F281DA6
MRKKDTLKTVESELKVNSGTEDDYTLDTKLLNDLSNSVDIVHFLSMIVERSHDGICITDGEAKKIYVNHAYEKITGLKKEELLGKSMQELQKAKIVSQSIALKVIKTKQSLTIEQTFKTGRKALTTMTPVFNEVGDVIYTVGNVRDITELIDLKAKYQITKKQSEEYKDKLDTVSSTILHSTGIVGSDKAFLNLLNLSKKVAKLDTTVLVLGETGVGKEELAKYIMKNSSRQNGSFIAVNCASLPHNLIESELFGYDEGAFTGSKKGGKKGLFLLADKGTIFLDEVGELSLEAQASLLRVMQEKVIRPVNSEKDIKIDVRIIAATNQDLTKMVKNGLFREDLFYRLNIFPVEVPPLRERRDDIRLLADFFIDRLNQKYDVQKKFTSDSIHVMESYHWPGNIRELRNVVERSFILSEQDEIFPSDITFLYDKETSQDNTSFASNIGIEKVDLKTEIARIELRAITKAYQQFGNVKDAAEALNLEPSTFVRKRKKYLGIFGTAEV